jgi:hypothetical protein
MHQVQTRLEALEQRSHPVARPHGWPQRLGGAMTRVAAGLLAVVVFLAGLLLAAPADEQPPPPVPITQDSVFLPAPNFCADFDVEITFPVFNQSYVQITVEPDGTTTYRITGHATATVTNLSTGKSVTYNISGPGTLVVYPDGSELLFSADLAGPNLLYTPRESLLKFPEVPTISYTTGHVTFEVDASGQTTEYALAGGARQTDVCAVLAAP